MLWKIPLLNKIYFRKSTNLICKGKYFKTKILKNKKSILILSKMMKIAWMNLMEILMINYKMK